MEPEEALQLIQAVRTGQFEDALVEVKAAARGVPKRLYETLSAFGNCTDGGLIILGLDEGRGFEPVGVANVQNTLRQLADQAARMDPPLRLGFTIVEVEGRQVVVVEVPECPFDQKPCFFSEAGMNTGSYIRVGNSNRRMTAYEIFSYISNRNQPTFDREAIGEVTLEDLDQERLRAYLDDVHRTRAALWRRLRMDDKSLEQQLCEVGVLTRSGQGVSPTLAGLLCFGIWPQKVFPSLVISFVRYTGTTKDERGPRGERFLDSARFEGSVPEIVAQAINHTVHNMRQSVLVDGIFHRNLAEYPVEAVREAVVNAVAHRDYSPMARGSAIRVEMYADRLQVHSPGGLYGPVNEGNLEDTQSTRNQLLMRFLEELKVVENRGSGIRAMIAAMREARLEPPRFRDTRNYFEVAFKNTSLMSPEAITWLNQFSGYRLNDNQRMALVYMRHNPRMTNSDYRRINSVSDTTHATRELRDLVESGLVTMQSTRRWATYTLSEQARQSQVSAAAGSEQNEILRYIRERGAITRSECASLLGAKPSHCTYVLRRMCDRGQIKRVGRKRWARYTLP